MKTATEKETQTLLDRRLLKVLLVEDEATDRISVERILRTCSSPAEFVVESVVYLSEAIKNLTEKQYDVVLLDLELPDSSGIEILHQVVKVAPDTPVVVLTERDDEQTGFSALKDGATDYLVKDLPLDVVLVRTIIYAIQRKKIQMQSLKLAHDNNERMKELNCLYGISNLVETHGISLEEMLEKTVHLIPAGWQYPDIACARIIFEGKEYKTDNFKPSRWTQSADITLMGQKAGTVEVGYMEQRPQSDEEPFLEEKRDLIDAIGERLGKMTERFKAEEKINNSQALLQRIINLLPVRVFWKDKNLRYLGCNEIFAKDAGKNNPEDLVGSDDFQTNWKEQAKSYRDDDQSVIKSGKQKLNYEEYQTTPKGDKICLKTSKVPLIDSQGNTIGLLGTYEDVTDRKQAEETLREKSALLVKIINSVPDFIFAKDTKLRTVICNEAYASAVGRKPEEMIGHTDIENGWNPELVCGNPAKGIRGFENDDRDALSGKTIHNPYDPANTPNGVLIFDTYKMPLRGKDGEITGMLGIARDITESKSAEEALRESNERYRNLFMANIDGMLVADATTRKFRYANPAICRMLGYSEEEFMQMGMADIHPKESLERVIAEFEAQTSSGAMVTAKDLQCVKKDGQIISVNINIVPVMINQTKYLLGIFRNSAECKSREKQDFS